MGFQEDKIKYHASSKSLTSPRPVPESDNPNGFVIYTNSMQYLCTTRSGKGNLYTLVMDMKGVSFPRALQLISEWTGCKCSSQEIVLPFGGFFKGLAYDSKTLDTELAVYDEKLLPPIACNQRFLRDGIGYKTQEKFGLRFDHENNAILIPIYNTNLELVGCKSRINEDNFTGNKYWANLSFQKSSVVYGLAQNYHSIIRNNKVIVFEAEKSVMQCADFRSYEAVAVMGHDISEVQATIIKSLMCDEIYVAFDEGVSLCEIKRACKQLKSNNGIYKNRVYYLYGGLPKNSKKSPSDMGKDKLKELLKDYKKEYVE